VNPDFFELGFGEEENFLQLGGYKVLIKCHKYRGQKLGTAFPEIPPLNHDEAATRIQSVHRGKQTRRNYGRR